MANQHSQRFSVFEKLTTPQVTDPEVSAEQTYSAFSVKRLLADDL
jgi:hypothetical protein